MDINNVIFYSFGGFVFFLLVLAEIFWGAVKKIDKTNQKPNVRLIWGLAILDGFFFFTFIVSLFTKLIKIIID